MAENRCTAVTLDLRDVARSAEDPKLASLLREGWRCEAHIGIEEPAPDGAVVGKWVLLMAPPPARPEIVATPNYSFALGMIVAPVGALIGALIGWALSAAL